MIDDLLLSDGYSTITSFLGTIIEAFGKTDDIAALL
jgi:hypothetical protein